MRALIALSACLALVSCDTIESGPISFALDCTSEKRGRPARFVATETKGLFFFFLDSERHEQVYMSKSKTTDAKYTYTPDYKWSKFDGPFSKSTSGVYMNGNFTLERDTLRLVYAYSDEYGVGRDTYNCSLVSAEEGEELRQAAANWVNAQKGIKDAKESQKESDERRRKEEQRNSNKL